MGLGPCVENLSTAPERFTASSFSCPHPPWAAAYRVLMGRQGVGTASTPGLGPGQSPVLWPGHWLSLRCSFSSGFEAGHLGLAQVGALWPPHSGLLHLPAASHPSSLCGPSLSQHPTFLETREVSGGCGLNPSPGDALREITSLWDSASLAEAGEERRSWKDEQSLEGRKLQKDPPRVVELPGVRAERKLVSAKPR